MTPAAWSWTLTVVGVFGLYVVSSGRRWGWLVNIAAQWLWIIYAVVTRQYGFIAAAIAYGAVFSLNYIRNRGAKHG